MTVSENDLLDTNWTAFKLIKSKVLEKTYAIVLNCKDKVSCVHFMKLLLNNTYELRVDKDENSAYKFIINFIGADTELFCELKNGADEFIRLLKEKELKTMTTGYVLDGKQFLNETMLPLKDDSFLLN